MSQHTFLILVSLEGLFFIGDVLIRGGQSSLHLYSHPLFVATVVPLPIVLSIAGVIGIVCCRGIIRGRRSSISLAWGAILLGVGGAAWDLLQHGVIIDWMRVGPLAFNGGDILIVGGIISLLIMEVRKHIKARESTTGSRITNCCETTTQSSDGSPHRMIGANS